MKIIRLTDADTQKPVYINAGIINAFREDYESGRKCTIISCGVNCWPYYVKEKPKEIWAMIEGDL